MATKTTNNTSEEVRASVSSIYADLLAKRRVEKEAKAAKKREEEELREQEKESKKYDEDGKKLSKKERRDQELATWQSVIVGLTGDDLEYAETKKSKKKYKKWIDEDSETSVLVPKEKKAKKKNYNKEFAPELQMLKTIVADQNRFTADLQKRFNAMAGPATKDAMPPNKTMVELASVINAGRSNSLGVLKEIGNLKKVIAELYIKQRKEEGANGGNGLPTDLALMGSGIASSLFADEPMSPLSQVQPQATQVQPGWTPTAPVAATATPIVATATPVNPVNPMAQSVQVQEFDPDSWEGPDHLKLNASVEYETIPHQVVVELNQATQNVRFKAVHSETGEELPNCPVPTYDPRNLALNEKDMVAKGQFDEMYKLEII